MWLCSSLFLCALSLSTLSLVEGERYSVYRVIPLDEHGLETLEKLRMMDHKYKLDFWKEPSRVGEHGDVMVSEKWAGRLEKKLARNHVNYTVAVADVQKLILRNEHGHISSSNDSRRHHDDPILDSEPDLDHSRVGRLKKAKYPFGDYASYADMMKYMRTIEFYYPNITKIVRIGTTHEGKPIEGLKIGRRSPPSSSSFSSSSSPRRAVWIDGNIHAREWASSHTALYFINQLVSQYGRDDVITHYVDSLDFFIVPCLNPDGYEYSRSSPMPNVRLWRKNRSPQKCQKSVWGGDRCCQGVDLNRNFRFHWSESGSSFEPCSNIYHGEDVFSEPEARAVHSFLSSPSISGRVDAFITLHSYAQLWIYPFSHAEQSYPDDISQLRKTARRAINRLETVYGTQYRMGTGADTLAPAAGGSDDWAKSEMGIKYVYLVELRPQMELSNGFILHKKELIPTAVETFEGVREVIDSVLELNGIKRQPMRSIPENLRKKQMFRMRMLGLTPDSPAPSTSSVADTSVMSTREQAQTAAPLSIFQKTTNSPPIQTVKPWKSKHFERLASQRAPTTPPMNDVINASSAPSTGEPVTTPPMTSSSSSSPRPATSGFYSNTQPISFRDPLCRDMRYSCAFWLRANSNVCQDQFSFMRAQCAFTCKFCHSELQTK